MLRVQSEQNMSELTTKLAVAAEEENRYKDREASLKIRIGHLEEVSDLNTFIQVICAENFILFNKNRDVHGE